MGLRMAGLPSRFTSSLRINPRTFRQAIFKIITAAYLKFKVFWVVTLKGQTVQEQFDYLTLTLWAAESFDKSETGHTAT